MSINIETKMTGFRELEKLLDQLPDRVNTRLANNAAAAGARVLQKNIKQRAPHAGLKKMKVLTSFKAAQHLRVNKKETVGMALVGFLTKKSGGLSRLAHLFEFGTSERFTKSGARRGRMVARPFIRPALASEKGAVLQKMTENLAKGLAREAAKARAEGY